MESLGDKEEITKIPLWFNCPKCGDRIITNFLRFGDELFCPYCNEAIAVPATAEVTSEDSNVLNQWKQSLALKPPQKKLTVADKIKKKYFKINQITGFVVTICCAIFLEDTIKNPIYRYLVSVFLGILVGYTIQVFEKQEKDSTPKSELDKELD